MNDAAIQEAALLIWTNFRDGMQINSLPASCRPNSRREGYAVQAEVARLSVQPSVGGNIAATVVSRITAKLELMKAHQNAADRR